MATSEYGVGVGKTITSTITSTAKPTPKMNRVSLPLLSSLHPDTTRPIVHQLLRECQAQRTIRSFLRRRLGKGKRIGNGTGTGTEAVSASASAATDIRSNIHSNMNNEAEMNAKVEAANRNDGGRCTTQVQTQTDPHTHSYTVPCAKQHFLFVALRSSYSLPVRQNACRILLDAVDTHERITTLCDVLWDMIRDDMHAFLSLCGDRSGTGASASASASNGSEGSRTFAHTREGILQLYGLMTHCLFARAKSTSKSKYSHTQTQTHTQTTRYYQFIYRGGLEWITSHILQLINLLMHTRPVQIAGGGSGGGGNRNVHENVNVNRKLDKPKPVSVHASDMDVDDETATATATEKKSTESGSGLGLKLQLDSSPKPSLSNTAKAPTGAGAGVTAVLSDIFSSPSVLTQPRHFFTAVTQSNNMSSCHNNTIASAHAMGVVSEDEIKDRLCLLVDFCLRITVLAHESESDVHAHADAHVHAHIHEMMKDRKSWKEGQEEDDDEDEEENDGLLGHGYGHATKKSLEFVHDYLWRKCAKSGNTNMSASGSVSVSGGEMTGTGSGTGTGSSQMTTAPTHTTTSTHIHHTHAYSNVSPLGSLLAASFILRNKSADMVLSAEDHVMMPDKRLDRINWMLARMVDVNGEIIVVSKEKDKTSMGSTSTSNTSNKKKDNHNKQKKGKSSDASGGGGGAMSSTGTGAKKRKRQDSITTNLRNSRLGARETARTLSSSLLHNNSNRVADNDTSSQGQGQQQDVGVTSSFASSSSARDATESLLHRIAKRARSIGVSGSAGGIGGGSSGNTDSTADALGSASARAILRAVTGGGTSRVGLGTTTSTSTTARPGAGGSSTNATTGGSESASSRSLSTTTRPRPGSSEGFSTAAEVMARTMSLSLLDRVHVRETGDSSTTAGVGGRGPSGTQARLVSRALGSSSLMELGGSGGGGGGGDNDDDDDHGDDDDDDDDEDYGNEGKNEDTEQEDGECADHDHDEEDDDESIHEEVDGGVDVDVDEENGANESMEIDEEIESDEEKVFGSHHHPHHNEEEDEEDELDNIIVEVASDPFQDDLMIVDSFDGNHHRSRHHQPLADILGGGARRKRAVSTSAPATSTSDKSKAWRSRAYLRASMELLDAQYPAIHLSQHGSSLSASSGKSEGESRSHHALITTTTHRKPILTSSAEQSMLQSICDIIKPPKKPLKLKVFMRRAPTQEEFFRGSLSRNPILISSLSIEQGASEPTVKDLRQHIANDLQMADSAELLELLVAKKILDLNLKLRVVSQTLWRTHVMDNVTTVHSESSFRQFMSGSSLGESGLLSRARVDENTPISSLPPMVVTYRLAGVDGEATEDKVEEGDLVDPDAPPDTDASKAEYEKKMEKEFGITRTVTKGRGVGVLLRSLEAHLGHILQKIRRDDIDARCMIGGRMVQRKNATRSLFLKSPPCSTLKLLQHCSMLSDNRKKLVKAQAPTILLRLLLDVLNSIDRNTRKRHSHQIQALQSSEEGGNDESNNSLATSPVHTIGNNPTADALQELIERLSSDISAEMSKKSKEGTKGDDQIDSQEISDDEGEGASTLPMLLSSLRTTSLSPPLRKVIAKLLPFLTYGQVVQSRALASQFISNIQFEFLGGDASLYEDVDGENKAVLMETFVDAAIHLPPVSVCDTLRSELIRQGFVDKIRSFILSAVPETPPSWTPALFSKTDKQSESEKKDKQIEWKKYYDRNGLQTAFEILIGLCKEHSETQSYLAANGNANSIPNLTAAAHWIESTSDKDDVKTNGLGILAETLLDTMLQDNTVVNSKIKGLRKKTRERKKEIAQERRSRALVDMSTFGRLAGDVGLASIGTPEEPVAKSDADKSIPIEVSSVADEQKAASPKGKTEESDSKPAWLLEMEAMEDEEGLTCAVCQEGRTYQPSEMLGLYAYMKKIAVPYNKGGGRGTIDGTLMFLVLPPTLPESLRGTDQEDDWHLPSLSLASAMKSTSHGSSTLTAATSSVMGSRSCYFVTTVTAGNAIHFSCHARARAADRNHPKAPKSEWEGASLRNSRVACNVILPLMSKENSKVPVMEMETSLADHQSAVSNMLGSKPKSMLWTVLHDIRLLILRISYGEALNNDCGGGSLSSNSALIFYSLSLADMFARDAEHDSPVTVKHAQGLSLGFLAASSILRASDFTKTSVNGKKLRRAFADAAPMAAICCILFNNTSSDDESPVTDNAMSTPPHKRRWEMYKDHFLSGLLQCAGRRHALHIEGSGCVQASTGRRNRSSSFSDWDADDHSSPSGRRIIYGKRSGLSIEDYAKALRPMITFYAILDQLSKEFTLKMDDEKVEKCSERLAGIAEKCQKAENIRTLISIAKITLDDTSIVEELEIGVNSI